MLVDVDTGRVLFGQNDHALLPPGSLTKMLTAMIAVDWLPPARHGPGQRPGRQRLPRPGGDEGRPALALWRSRCTPC